MCGGDGVVAELIGKAKVEHFPEVGVKLNGRDSVEIGLLCACKRSTAAASDR